MLPMCNHSLIIVCSRLQLNLCVSHILLTMADQAHPEIDQVAELAQEPAEGDDDEAALKVTAKEVPDLSLNTIWVALSIRGQCSGISNT